MLSHIQSLLSGKPFFKIEPFKTTISNNMHVYFDSTCMVMALACSNLQLCLARRERIERVIEKNKT